MAMMPELTEGGLPLTHDVQVGALEPGAANPVSLSLTDGEAQDVAVFLGLGALSGAALTGTLMPFETDGWRLEGKLTATVGQTCVVTLTQVESRIDAPVERRFLPAHRIVSTGDIDVLLNDEEEPEPFTETIGLGRIFVESLALLIDPWPRAEGAEFGNRIFAPDGVEPLTDEAARPFSGLAALKAKLTRNEE
ncbi:MAG: DUF177 domain-containing protein [Pseudomonadota bacterium]